MPKITYRIGSADWSLTITENNGNVTRFDIAAMSGKERGAFFGKLRQMLKQRYA